MHNRASLIPHLSCLIAATLWGVLWYPLRLLNEAGLPGVWATLLIYISAMLVVIPVLNRKLFEVGRITWLIGIALAAGWTNLAFILALLEGTVVRVLLLFYLSPVWAVLLARVFLGEHLTRQSMRNLVLAGAGALILLWDEQLAAGSPTGPADALAISSGMAFAVTNVLLRRAGTMPIQQKMVSAWAGVIFLCLPGILFTSPAVPDFTAYSLLLAIAVGVFGMVAMTFTAQYGVTHLPVQKSAILFLFEVPVGAVSAALLSAEAVTLYEYIGGALVLLAAWLTARQQ
ncbi:MAG: DMT family transporter [Thiotrichales bacterium]|nr:DMT family transporter [Thiotrichales bacterium]